MRRSFGGRGVGSAAGFGGAGEGDGVTDVVADAEGGVEAGGDTDRAVGSDGVSGPATARPTPPTATTATAARATCRGVGAVMTCDPRPPSTSRESGPSGIRG